MDRFIGKILLSKINSSVCLKSNMDRFIVFSFAHSIRKRNMFKIQYGQIYSIYYFVDKIKFLAFKIQYGQIYSIYQSATARDFMCLKSNMDRFIALLHNTNGFGTKRFKIQYGQIYRIFPKTVDYQSNSLKSNMDRFIGTCDYIF